MRREHESLYMIMLSKWSEKKDAMEYTVKEYIEFLDNDPSLEDFILHLVMNMPSILEPKALVPLHFLHVDLDYEVETCVMVPYDSNLYSKFDISCNKVNYIFH